MPHFKKKKKKDSLLLFFQRPLTPCSSAVGHFLAMNCNKTRTRHLTCFAPSGGEGAKAPRFQRPGLGHLFFSHTKCTLWQLHNLTHFIPEKLPASFYLFLLCLLCAAAYLPSSFPQGCREGSNFHHILSPFLGLWLLPLSASFQSVPIVTLSLFAVVIWSQKALNSQVHEL